MDNSVVYISDESGNLLGTGFIVEDDLEEKKVITCGHVIECPNTKYYVNGQLITVEKNCLKEGTDLAIATLESFPENTESLRLASLERDSIVNVVGYSTFVCGKKKVEIHENIKATLSAKLVDENNNSKTSLLKLTAERPLDRGYSGSPIIDSDRNVVGVLSWRADNDNYGVCASHLLSLLGVSEKKHSVGNIRNSVFGKISELEVRETKTILRSEFESALKTYESLKDIWFEPKLYDYEENKINNSNIQRSHSVDSLIENPVHTEITAKQQYGATTLARYLAFNAWESRGYLWVYIKATELKPHKKEIIKQIKKACKKLRVEEKYIDTILIDDIYEYDNETEQAISLLTELYPDLPIIFFTKERDSASKLIANSLEVSQTLYLHPLRRYEIRSLVTTYTDGDYISSVDAIVNKLISDLEAINVPRTVLNCLMLLKIYEYHFDESPINRSDMIHRVLTLVFNSETLPTYRKRPDLKDTEHILGYFCEEMIRSNKYCFSSQEFISKLHSYCDLNELDLEVHVIFDTLCRNNIVTNNGDYYCFKFTYWIFYFAAHRMHHSPDFVSFILDEKQYVKFPEIIEFYSGIDRQRDNLVEKLTNDLRDIRVTVAEALGFPAEFEIFDLVKWNPSAEQIQSASENLENSVIGSNLPLDVKDQIADKTYDFNRPLHQGVNEILEEYRVLRLMKTITSCCRVLRNSSYVNVKLKHQLIDEILNAWLELSKVIVCITPLLARDGKASVDGTNFQLVGNFGDEFKERVVRIIKEVPSNIEEWFKDDIFSDKLGSMLIKRADLEGNRYKKHLLNLLILLKRPDGWQNYLEKFISSEDKNSFYLYDLHKHIDHEYRVSFAGPKELKHLAEFMKKTYAKHAYGNIKKVNRIKDDFLPKRKDDLL